MPVAQLKYTSSAVDGSACYACCQQTCEAQNTSQKHLLDLLKGDVGFLAVAKWVR